MTIRNMPFYFVNVSLKHFVYPAVFFNFRIKFRFFENATKMQSPKTNVIKIHTLSLVDTNGGIPVTQISESEKVQKRCETHNKEVFLSHGGH